MKVKAVIFRPDRTNNVVVVRQKDIDGKVFRHANVTYFLHPDRFMVTWVGKGLLRRYFATYYYVEGITNPLPVPDFQIVDDADTRAALLAAKKGEKVVAAQFPKIIDLGVKGEEIGAMFNPWFFRVIAAQIKDAWKEIGFWIQIATLLGVALLAWHAFQSGDHGAATTAGAGTVPTSTSAPPPPIGGK